MQLNKSDDIINYFYQNLERNYNEIVHYNNKKIFTDDVCFGFTEPDSYRFSCWS